MRAAFIDRRHFLPAANAWLLGVACLMAASQPLLGQTDDQRFIEGLRARRLYRLAETYCRQSLQRQLEPIPRAALTIELTRTFAAHAINSAPKDRAGLWSQAREVAAEFSQNQPDNPHLALLRMQDALTVLAQGELTRQEAEVGAASGGGQQVALELIREAVRLLEQLEVELTRDIPQRRRAPERGGLLSADELFSLRNHVRFQMARALRNRALCYAPESDDQIAALTSALDQHEKLLGQLAENDPLIWLVRLDQIVCYRRLGDLTKSSQLIAALMNSTAPISIKLDARAEAVRLELAGGRPQKAIEILTGGRQIEGQISAELDFAHLETYIVQWQAAAKANDDAQSAAWQEKAVAMVRLVEREHGPYWGRRANLLLVRSAASGHGPRDLEILVRRADEFVIKGQFDDAVAAYDEAAAKAHGGGKSQLEFELRYKAALVRQQKQQRYGQASDRLRKLALSMRDHDNAAAAHLLAAWNASQVVQQDPSTLPQYIALLEKQIAIWPDGASTDTARIWLARLREHARSWPEAIEAYLGVSSSSPQYEQAVQSAARLSQIWLVELKNGGQPYEKQAALAVRFFEDVILGPEGRLPQKWSDIDRLSAVTAARIRLQFTTDGHAAAAGLLQSARNASPDAPHTWQVTVDSLLVVALAAQQDRRDEAKQMIQRLADGQPSELLEMFAGLSAIAQSARPEAQAEIAQLQLEAAELLNRQRPRLDDAGRLTLDRVRADALAGVGRRDEALQAYKKLAASHPNHGRIQVGYARLLLAGEDVASLTAALGQWRIVASKSRPRTERWYEAKYSVALSQFKLGQKEKAAQFIRYMQVTPPGLDATPLKAKFLALLKRCES